MRVRPEFLPFSPPFIGEEEIEEVVSALRSGWISRGPRTARFERAFSEFIGADAALGLNSCTAGLHLSLLALGISEGDEVIVPTMTFCASVNVIEHVGARPVLVDVVPDTLNLDAGRVASAVTASTKAIIVVHYGGHPADMPAIERIAQREHLAVVEDAAHALPASSDGVVVGSRPNLTAFSFYATKNLTTGEGGMLTGPPALVEKARLLSLHGMSGDAWRRYSNEGSWYYEVVAPGYKYNMTDIQAAIGLRQLERLKTMQSRRREIAERYTAKLSKLEELILPRVCEGVEAAWHLYPVRVRKGSGISRGEFIKGMTARRIGTSVHFIPIHLHPYYRDRYDLSPEDFPVAQAAFEGLVSLPLHPGLTDEDVEDVIASVQGVVRGQ
ncbi:MAG: DegT/DnrJ/EryC1/StrS family aminotransferase [Gemmatimonadota bacterium]